MVSVDCTELNNVTKKNSFPLRKIFDNFPEKAWFLILDLKSVYFCVDEGLSQFTVMSLSLCNEEWTHSKKFNEIRSCIVLCSYDRRFVSGFVNIPSSLHDLTKTDVKFKKKKKTKCSNISF